MALATPLRLQSRGKSIILSLNIKSSGRITIVNSVLLTQLESQDQIWLLAETVNVTIKADGNNENDLNQRWLLDVKLLLNYWITLQGEWEVDSVNNLLIEEIFKSTFGILHREKETFLTLIHWRRYGFGLDCDDCSIKYYIDSFIGRRGLAQG